MASVSASTLIIFIASILVAASVAGTMTTGVSQLGDALDDRSLDVANEVRTDIDIISDPGSDAVYSNGDVVLLVKNTGSQSLSTDPDTLDIIIDGEYQTNVSTTIAGDESDWRPGAVLEVTTTKTLSADGNPHRVVVIVNDNRETFEFRV